MELPPQRMEGALDQGNMIWNSLRQTKYLEFGVGCAYAALFPGKCLKMYYLNFFIDRFLWMELPLSLNVNLMTNFRLSMKVAVFCIEWRQAPKWRWTQKCPCMSLHSLLWSSSFLLPYLSLQAPFCAVSPNAVVVLRDYHENSNYSLPFIIFSK